jgi:hypothetical protein
VLGILVATITTDSTLGLVRMGDERRQAVLAGQGDTAPPRPGAQPGAPPGYLILVHRDYPRGTKPVPIPSDRIAGIGKQRPGKELQLQELKAFDHDSATDVHYVDPLNATHQLAGFAQVGNTELVVIVQQPYDEAVESHTAWAVISIAFAGAATFLALLLAGFVFRLAARGKGSRVAEVQADRPDNA